MKLGQTDGVANLAWQGITDREHAQNLACGRDNQIIAATTSPELLSSARTDQIIDLSCKSG